MIFLTGGTGMLGAHLLLDLTKSGSKVMALRRKDSDLNLVRKIFSWYSDEADLLFEMIEWVEGNVLDKTSLQQALEGVDTVIHAAAKVSFDPRDHAEMLYENEKGTANLVDLAIELNILRFCHVSSVAALGDYQTGVPVDEEFSWKNDRQRSAYSESKFLSEMEVWRGIQEGLSAVIVNPSIILGPGNWNSSSPRLFKTIGKGLKFYTTGMTGYVDVRDVSRAIIGLLRAKDWETIKNQRYILSAENHTYQEIFNRIAVALNRPKPGIRASRLMLNLGWRASRMISLLTGGQPTLTRETARSAVKVSEFDGSKITRSIDFVYTPIETTINDIGRIYLSSNK
jgi:nucleoside-diphosphate-sugar epimerase